MKRRMHRHSIKFPAFGGYVIRVVFTDNAAAEFVRLKEPKPGDAEAWTITDPEGYAHILLKHDVDAETIAHESFHAVFSLMRFAGAAMEEEVVAYHLGHVVGLITKWAKRPTSS